MKIHSTVVTTMVLLLAFAAESSGEEYKLKGDSLVQEGVPKGAVTEHIWDSCQVFPGTIREYWVYVPAQYDAAIPACVMVFQDGGTYIDPEGPVHASTVFDNLIHKREMPVTIGIFINPGRKVQEQRNADGSPTPVPSLVGKTLTTGSDDEVYTWVFGEDGEVRVSGGQAGDGMGAKYEQDGRNVHIQVAGHELAAIYDGEKLELNNPQDQRSLEYDSLGDRYARFLLEEILPEIGKDYNLIDAAAGRAIGGISSGGICAFTVAWERPDAFSKVIGHVGSFTNIRGGHVYPSMIRKTRGNPKPMRVFLQDGENDLNITEGDWTLGNRQMESALKFAGYDYRFEMGTGGHDLEHGGAILPETLRWIWRDYPGVKGAEKLAIKKTKVGFVPSLAGKTLTTGEGDEVYTWAFGKEGELRVSGGKAGDGVDGEYKQDGTGVYIWTAEMKLKGTYDGEELKIGEGKGPDTSVPSLVGKTLTTESDGEVTTWVFGEEGEVRVSGGKAGDGVDGEYKQDGTGVYIWTAEMKLKGTYDGEELEIEEAQSRDEQEYELTGASFPLEGVPRGAVTKHTWQTSRAYPDTTHDYWVYVPVQYTAAKPACVTVFLDGKWYVEGVPIVFDNLIHKGKMPVTIGIFINPGQGPGTDSREQRSIEYDSLGNRYACFLLEEILPDVGKDYNLVENAEGRAICGISSGGICAFTVAWERPDAFSKVISHVGAFTNIRGGHEYPSLIRRTRGNPKPIRVFLQAGTNDLNWEYGDFSLGNLQMESALKFARYDYRFEMGTGGHNMEHGRAILPEMLQWLWRDYPGVKGADELAIKGTKVSAAPSLVGMTLTTGEGDEKYTWAFGKDGELHVSGG